MTCKQCIERVLCIVLPINLCWFRIFQSYEVKRVVCLKFPFDFVLKTIYSSTSSVLSPDLDFFLFFARCLCAVQSSDGEKLFG